MIDLNVAEAIHRGQTALNLSKAFLQYHNKKQVIGKWTGVNRNIHFLALKQSQVQQNLVILKADLFQAHEQYRLPGYPPSPPSPPPRPTNRHKRGINLDIKFDVNTALRTVVQGVVSIFSSPKSLDKIQQSVDKVAYRTSRLESKFANFTDNIDTILHWMKIDFEHNVDEVHMLASIVSALDLANEAIMELLQSITPLVRGQLTHNLLDPLQTQNLLDKIQIMANVHGLQVVVTQPMDILKCAVTTFATETSWFALLSIPLVYKKESMNAYQFINIPWFYRNQSIQWAFRDGIVATQPGLFPTIENVFVPMEELDRVCERFNNIFLCHKRINHFPTCQVSLLYNSTNHCSLKRAAPKVRYSFGSLNFLFFQLPTVSLLECPEGKTSNELYYGLINFEQISKCTIKTTRFTLLPKSPAHSEVSTLIHQPKPVFILDSEWIKVEVAFNNRKHNRFNPEEPNPWQHVDIISNYEEEVRVFGSHTVLVHSVAMFLIIAIIIIILSICITNCQIDPPFLPHDHPSSIPLDSLSFKDDIIPLNHASPGGEVFPLDMESPVT